MTKRAALRFPDRKISETFLDFASPIMNDLPSEAAEHRARQALQVSFTVWNAVIFADVLNDHGYIDQIRYLSERPQRSRRLFAVGITHSTKSAYRSVAALHQSPFCLPNRYP